MAFRLPRGRWRWWNWGRAEAAGPHRPVKTHHPDRIRNYVEPSVYMGHKPLEHDLVDPEGGEVSLKHTYANNLQAFEADDLNDLHNVKTTADEKPQLNEELAELYRDQNTGVEFNRLKYTEVLYPMRVNSTLKKTRGRTAYGLDFWNTKRADRNIISGSNSQGFTVTLQSKWPLDAPVTFADSDYRAPNVEELGNVRNAASSSAAPSYSLWNDFSHGSRGIMTSSVGGHGELLNTYNMFSGAAGVQFNWPKEEICLMGDGTPGGGSGFGYNINRVTNTVQTASISWAGATHWDAPTQAGKAPFYYDSYDAYAADIKLKGQDYSIVPEYRIGDFIPHYYANTVEDVPDFLQSIQDIERITGKGVFSITGADYVDSRDDSFYKTYSHSDFLKHFYHLNDLNYAVSDKTRFLTLRPKALIKFIPYKGFYPVQRTVELATLFSESYGKHVVLTGDDANFKTFLTPLFGPGVLYNSIKAGLAVDFPVLMDTDGGNGSKIKRAYLSQKSPEGGRQDAANIVDSTGTSNGASRRANGPQRSVYFGMWSGSQQTSFDYRVPFEALVLPEEHLVKGARGINGKMSKLRDMEPHALIHLDSTASWDGQRNNELYKLGMNNFLAESIDFFLQEGKLTSFSSWPEHHERFGMAEKDKKYIMDIKISAHQSDVDNESDYGNDRHLVTSAREFYRNSFDGGGNLTKTDIYHYDFGFSNYGPACQAFGGTAADTTSGLGAHPFSPPYSYSPSFIRLAWTAPEARKFSLDEIMNDLEVSLRQAYKHGTGLQDGQFALYNSMQLTASLNYLGITSEPKVEWVNVAVHDPASLLPAEQWAPGRVIPDQTQKVWTIQTKWETPIMDFSSASLNLAGRLPTMPVSGAKSVTYGIWHQYGVTSSATGETNQAKTSLPINPGVFLELRNSKKVIFSGVDPLLADPTTGSVVVGSLADLVGFARESKKLGPARESKIIKECVVLIPYIFVRGSRRYIALNKRAISRYLRIGTADTLKRVYPNSTPAIRKTLDIMRSDDYIFPPMLDYVSNHWRDGGPDPFLMLAFEFSTVLSRKDVLDIWQNLPPDCAFKFEHQEVDPLTIDLSEFSQLRGIKRGVNPLFGGGHYAYGPMKKVRWMVFKVKQRAKNNYFGKVARNTLDDRFEFDQVIGGRREQRHDDKERKYSYNWPYDYFSLIELLKIDAEVEFRSPASVDEEEDLREDPPPRRPVVERPAALLDPDSGEFRRPRRAPADEGEALQEPPPPSFEPPGFGGGDQGGL